MYLQQHHPLPKHVVITVLKCLTIIFIHSSVTLADFPYNIYEHWGRIYSGKEANAVIPYQVRISVVRSTNEVSWSCGGTIISPNHILTARHCIETKEHGSLILSETYIEAGFYKLEGRETFPSYQVLMCFIYCMNWLLK